MSLPFVLQCDSSTKAFGAILSQLDELGRERVIAYASKKLTKHESNYPVIELEAAGISWAIQKFDQYLFGNFCRIYTDHRPLAYISKIAQKSTRLAKYALIFQRYHIEIIYKKGSQNTNCDSLTRQE